MSLFPFVTAEIANNHMGSVQIGRRLITEIAAAGADAVKFQYRDLSILHPDIETKYHKRFTETNLNDAERYDLVSHAIKSGITPICTPFDEISVDQCVRHGIPILKVASCSADDWPLLEKMAETNLPIIASTGGLDFDGIDRLYYFLKNRFCTFMLLHCVAKYPCDNPSLGMIRAMQDRYPVPIGYSDHSGDPLMMMRSVLAGAVSVEVHVTDPEIYKNDYSISVGKDLARGISLANDARGMMDRHQVQPGEEESLKELRRGNYDGKLMIPSNEKQDYTVTQMVRTFVHRYEAMFRIANIPLNGERELSHHYGLEKFETTGAFLVTVVNKEYCKKLISLLPGQSHPEHLHKKKNETFQCLSGQLTVTVDGQTVSLLKGECLDVPAGAKHSFHTAHGCIFEEISTHAERGDSYYTSPAIQRMDPMSRKTVLEAE